MCTPGRDALVSEKIALVIPRARLEWVAVGWGVGAGVGRGRVYCLVHKCCEAPLRRATVDGVELGKTLLPFCTKRDWFQYDEAIYTSPPSPPADLPFLFSPLSPSPPSFLPMPFHIYPSSPLHLPHLPVTCLPPSSPPSPPSHPSPPPPPRRRRSRTPSVVMQLLGCSRGSRPPLTPLGSPALGT